MDPKVGTMLEKARKQFDPESDEAILLGIFRDISFKLSRNIFPGTHLDELETEADNLISH